MPNVEEPSTGGRHPAHASAVHGYVAWPQAQTLGLGMQMMTSSAFQYVFSVSILWLYRPKG